MNQSKGNRQPQGGRRQRVSQNLGRSITNQTTGFTGDLKPQMMTITATQSAADTTTTIRTALPVLRNFTSAGGRAQIVEVLKAYIYLANPAEVDSNLRVFISTKDFGVNSTNFGESTVFAHAGYLKQLTTSGLIETPTMVTVDLSDGAGNGQLIATDNVFVQVVSATTGVANTVYVKLLYRITGATVTEYVGIVQGQQSS